MFLQLLQKQENIYSLPLLNSLMLLCTVKIWLAAVFSFEKMAIFQWWMQRFSNYCFEIPKAETRYKNRTSLTCLKMHWAKLFRRFFYLILLLITMSRTCCLPWRSPDSELHSHWLFWPPGVGEGSTGRGGKRWQQLFAFSHSVAYSRLQMPLFGVRC